MDDMKGRPVFIVGYPRSGTTLLLHFILSSGDFPSYDFSETHFYSHYFRRYGDVSRIGPRSRFLEAISKADWIHSAPFEIDRVVEVSEERGFGYGSFLRAYMDLLAAEQGKNRWVEKTPWHSLYLDRIVEDFPDAQFIHIVRDPRDVCLSVTGAGWAASTRSRAARIALSWSYHVERVRKAGLDSLLSFRYEDLIGSPKSVLASLNTFLGTEMELGSIVERSQGVMSQSNTSHSDAVSGLSNTPVGRWVSSDRPDLMDTVERLAGQEMRNWNYEARVSRWTSLPCSLAARCYAMQKGAKRGLFPLVRR